MDHSVVSPPHKQVDRLDRLWQYMGYALHVLVALLVVVVLFNDGFDWRIVVFGAIYAGGLVVVAPRWLWLLLVVISWAAMVFVFQSAAFIAFALFFVAIAAVRPQVAIPVDVVITAIAVFALARFNGWTIGGIVGPIVGVTVALALGLGFQMLRRGAIAEAEASRHAGEMGERARVAADIHDTVAQGLSSIQMLLFSVERRLVDLDDGGDATSSLNATTHAKVLEEIRLARATAEDNLAETRRIIAALQPAPLAGADLLVALARVCSTTPLGKALSFEMDGEPFPLPEQTQEAVVRITQSLVSNVVRHADASKARVTLTYQPGAVAVDVVDNGKGFDPESLNLTRESSVGLSGVLRRAELCGGSTEIETSPGEGCGVSVHIPAPEVKVGEEA